MLNELTRWREVRCPREGPITGAAVVVRYADNGFAYGLRRFWVHSRRVGFESAHFSHFFLSSARVHSP